MHMQTIPIKLSGLFWNPMKVKRGRCEENGFKMKWMVKRVYMDWICPKYMIFMYEMGYCFNKYL